MIDPEEKLESLKQYMRISIDNIAAGYHKTNQFTWGYKLGFLPLEYETTEPFLSFEQFLKLKNEATVCNT
jgi:hypothetical protein